MIRFGERELFMKYTLYENETSEILDTIELGSVPREEERIFINNVYYQVMHVIHLKEEVYLLVRIKHEGLFQ